MGLAAWMKNLLRKAASALGAVENVVPEGGNDTEDIETLTVFDDTIKGGSTESNRASQ